MTPRFRSLPEQVQALQVTQGQQARQLRVLEGDNKRSAGQAEAALDDVRTLSELARRLEARLDKTDARILVIAGHQGEQLVVMKRMADALEELRPTVHEARDKASGAHHRAVNLEEKQVKLEARQSLTEEQVRQALDDAAAQSKAIVANPPPLDELTIAFVKAAKPMAPRVVQAIVGLIVVACGAAGVFLTQRCGGF